MQKFIFIILFVIISISQLFAQKITNKDFGDPAIISQKYNKLVKFQPGKFFYGSLPLVGEYGFALERKIDMKFSMQGEAAYLGNGLLYLVVYNNDTSMKSANEPRMTMNGFRVQGSLRYYFTKKAAPEGLFIAPHFSYATCKYSTTALKNKGQYIQATHIDYSLIAGWQHVYNDKISFEIFFGATYRNKTWVDKSLNGTKVLNTDDIKGMYLFQSNIRPKFGMTLGFVL